MYVVFSQDPDALPDASRLHAQAARFFGAGIERLDCGSDWVRVRLSSAAPVIDQEFVIFARAVAPGDLALAREAEARGRAAGMATLAARCRCLWELEVPHGQPKASLAAVLTLCAICASVALGPVMPPDHATLFGVRGAIERRERETKAS